MSLEEQAGLARKTLGAFGFNAITVSGDVCDELFVPSHPPPHAYAVSSSSSSSSTSSGASDKIPSSSSSSSSMQGEGGGGTLEQVQERLRMFSHKERQERQERRWREQEQEQQQQLGVFKVGGVDEAFVSCTRGLKKSLWCCRGHPIWPAGRQS